MKHSLKIQHKKRPKFGDIVEFVIPKKGLMYAQYVKRHDFDFQYGPLIRILPGCFKKRPETVEHLARQKELYVTFFQLIQACNSGFATIVGTADVEARFNKWPLFKQCNQNRDGEKTWFIFDGSTETKIGRLPEKYYDLPMVEVPDFLALEERLASGWTPRDEV